MAARHARDEIADLAEQRRREMAELGRLQGKATEAEEVFLFPCAQKWKGSVL